MRKRLLISLIMMVLLVTTVTVAMAADKTQVDVYDQQKNLVKSVVFVVGHDQYFVNGQTPGVKMDAKPFIENGRTFVPVRYLSNALGVTDKHIGWESPRVTLDEPGFPVVELAVGSKTIKSNGKATTMDVSPLVKQGRTYLPARFVAEALGYQVGWDAGTGTVTVSKDGNAPPPPVVNADPTNPPIEYDEDGWPVIKVETAQKLFGPLVPPQELIANGNKVALKWESRDVLLNPSTRINPNTYIEEPVGGTWLKNYLPAPYKTRTGEYVDRSGKKVKGQTQYFPLKEMLLLAGFPEQNIFWNPQTKTMVIYGSHFHQDDYYSVTKIVAGVEVQPKALVPAPLVENGSLLVSDGPYSYVVGKAFRSGDVPIYSRQIGTDLYIFD